MDINEVVQFLQENSQALVMFATPRFSSEYLNKMKLLESDEQTIHNFINQFFELISNVNIQAIAEVLPKTVNSLSKLEALLFVLAYSLDDANNNNVNEISQKENSLKQFVKNNDSISNYIRDNITTVNHVFNVFYAAIGYYTQKLIPWLSNHADFLIASAKPEFSKFVNALPLKHRVTLVNYSDRMKSFFARSDIRHPNVTLTYFEDVKNSVRFDPLCYYLTRIAMLSDLNSKVIARANLKVFFTVNPALMCFMAFEIESLEPIIRLWNDQRLGSSVSRITSVLSPRRTNVLSPTQSSLDLTVNVQQVSTSASPITSVLSPKRTNISLRTQSSLDLTMNVQQAKNKTGDVKVRGAENDKDPIPFTDNNQLLELTDKQFLPPKVEGPLMQKLSN